MKNYKFDFYKNKNKFFIASLSVFLLGIIFNFIFGVKLDMQFTGGSVIKYSYLNKINEQEIKNIVNEKSGKEAETRMNESLENDMPNSVTLSFAGTEAMPLEVQKEITDSLNEKFPDNEFKIIESSSVDPSMGKNFFMKCIICVILAAVLLIFYIALRFKKIGGAIAGTMAIVALLHDVIMIYFTFIIFKIPLNDNFIAVVLTILGYSLNDTIVIYDRIRENRKVLGPKTELSELVNISINQSLGRSINTSLSTFISVSIVFIFGLIYNLNTITTFALPMMVGTIVGCYSSLCIASPLYVMCLENKSKSKNRKRVACINKS